MEGLKIIEKSYNNLKRFKDIITGKTFETAVQLVINLPNYDMQTQEGIRTAISNVLEVYKDDLDLDLPISKILAGNVITIKIPKDVEGFRDALEDSLLTYINPRLGNLFSIISNGSNSGGIYSV